MTAIAIRNGVIAADSSRWHGELCFGTCQKVFRLKAGALLTGAGNEATILAMYHWIDAGMPSDRVPGEDTSEDGFTVFWLTRFNELMRFDDSTNYVSEPAPFIAAGMHSDFLMGAMAAGASAEQAVTLAIAHCAFARGPIQVERL